MTFASDHMHLLAFHSTPTSPTTAAILLPQHSPPSVQLSFIYSYN